MGVPSEAILIENQSTNTGENIQFTKKLLEEKGINPEKLIVVQKPYMERRTYATFKANWPGKEIIVTSPKIGFENYPNEDITLDMMMNVMVGDLQRIKEYPKKGFQIYQEIPEEVWKAYEYLISKGYDKHLIV